MGNRAKCIANDIDVCLPATPTQVLVTATILQSPKQLTATARTYFRSARILAVKALAGTNNASPVNLGFSATASQQPKVLAAGTEWLLEAPLGEKWDLSTLYLTVAADNDGVVVIYS